MATKTKTKNAIMERIAAIYSAVTALRKQAMISAEQLVELLWFGEDANTEALIEQTGYKSYSEWFRKDPKMGSSAFNAVYLGIVNDEPPYDHHMLDEVHAALLEVRAEIALRVAWVLRFGHGDGRGAGRAG